MNLDLRLVLLILLLGIGLIVLLGLRNDFIYFWRHVIIIIQLLGNVLNVTQERRDEILGTLMLILSALIRLELLSGHHELFL